MFIEMDFCNYYNSIDQVLLKRALLYATNKTRLNRQETNIIRLARKTVIQFQGKYWTRKDTMGRFVIPLGGSDSAEITDLVGLFLLMKIKSAFPYFGNGLYRDERFICSSKL